MTEETFYYIGSAVLVGLGTLIVWYVRWSITKNKSNWERVFTELAEIRQNNAVASKDLGFLFGEQKQYTQQIEKHSARLLQNETRITRIETRLEEHLKTA